ncbi:MAG: hypothetical protein A2Z95_08645 [Gallionellales bacterium GWA2_60_18]|nr:MAG: hypothetical protein A2Z95_08645 [Gallionellales bacterium GWA2_60_18]
MAFYRTWQIKHLRGCSELIQTIKVEFLCVILSKSKLTTANKERSFLPKSRCFNLNESLTSRRLEREDVITQSITFSFRDVLHFIRQSLVTKVMQSEMFEVQNKFFPGATERSISGFPLKIITFLRNG